jgi:hypothetical protein
MTYIKVKVDSSFAHLGDTSADTLHQRYPKIEPVLTGVGDTLGYVGYLIPGLGSCACAGACAGVRARTGGIEKRYPRYPQVSRISTIRGSRCGYLRPKVSPRYPQGIPDPVIVGSTTKETT